MSRRNGLGFYDYFASLGARSACGHAGLSAGGAHGWGRNRDAGHFGGDAGEGVAILVDAAIGG
jgi:hypothetical protein